MLERTKNRESYLAPPIQRAVRLIRHIAEGHSVINMSETAKALKINRTTLLRLLHTLDAEGFVERRPDGAGYQVGIGLLGIAARTLFSQDVVRVSVPVVTRLAETLQLSAHLGILDGTDVVYLVRRTPDVPLASNVRVGSRLPAHATTMGRIILAHLPATRVDSMFAGKTLQRFSEHTPTTLSEIHARASADRKAGITWSDAHFESGISSAAVAVFDYAGDPVGAINVSGPVASFSEKVRRVQIGEALRSAGREISQRLGWIDPASGPTSATAGPARSVTKSGAA